LIHISKKKLCLSPLIFAALIDVFTAEPWWGKALAFFWWLSIYFTLEGVIELFEDEKTSPFNPTITAIIIVVAGIIIAIATAFTIIILKASIGLYAS